MALGTILADSNTLRVGSARRFWEKTVSIKRSGVMEKQHGDESGPSAPNSLLGKKKAHIEQVLNLVEGDLEQAARLLDISVSKLRRWMRKLEIPET